MDNDINLKTVDKIRRALQIRQADLAKVLGIEQTTVAAKLIGRNGFNTREIKKMSDLFGVPVDLLYQEVSIQFVPTDSIDLTQAADRLTSRPTPAKGTYLSHPTRPGLLQLVLDDEAA